MPQDVFARHTFTPTWGELNRTTTFPTPFVLHFDDPNKAELLPIISRALDATTSFAQAVFLSEFEGLILVGHDTMEDGRRLGIVYWCANENALSLSQDCMNDTDSPPFYSTNRRNGLWLAPVPKRGGDGATFDELTRISAEGRSTRSPRILPRARDDMDGKDLLIYLSNPVGGVHNSCATLHARRVAYDGASVEDDVLVGPVWKPAHIGGFPGLYLQSLPARPFMFVSGRAYVVFSTLDRSQQVNHRVRLDLDNKPVESEAILDRSGYASSVILGTDGKAQMVFVSSDMLSPQRIYSVKFSSHDQIEAEHQLLPSFVQPRGEFSGGNGVWREDVIIDSSRSIIFTPPHSLPQLSTSCKGYSSTTCLPTLPKLRPSFWAQHSVIHRRRFCFGRTEDHTAPPVSGFRPFS